MLKNKKIILKNTFKNKSVKHTIQKCGDERQIYILILNSFEPEPFQSIENSLKLDKTFSFYKYTCNSNKNILTLSLQKLYQNILKTNKYNVLYEIHKIRKVFSLKNLITIILQSLFNTKKTKKVME